MLTTFALATPPEAEPRWRENAMIWEAADPYFYIRTDPNERIIAGSEDIDAVNEETRDRLMSSKAAKVEALLRSEPIAIDCRWGATFGSSPDSLPSIGPVTTMPHVSLAAGYGGNEIAFAGLAARIAFPERKTPMILRSGVVCHLSPSADIGANVTLELTAR